LKTTPLQEGAQLERAPSCISDSGFQECSILDEKEAGVLPTTETVISINLITSNPQVRGGRPCIARTSLRVTDVVMAYLFHDQSPDEIAAGYAVPLAGVYAALAYYYEHKAELDEDIRRQIETARKLKAEWIANGGTSVLPAAISIM
jgi:uncharacterized protein (DUF433 family)